MTTTTEMSEPSESSENPEQSNLVAEGDLPANLKNLWLKALSAVELRNYGYAVSLLQAVLKEEPKFLDGRKMCRKAAILKSKSEKNRE